MAVYKVIQNIEAEDKLLGPLTLKGFIYMAIAGVLAFVNFRIFIAGGPIYVRLAVVLILAMPMILFGVLASPLGRDQPTEVWLLSHIRFLLKQRGRVWDQAGLDNLVTITAPKRIEQHLTKEFSQSEVHSRLSALATTLDSRGWAVKNSTVNLSTQADYINEGNAPSDRLITPSGDSQPAPVIDIHASDDILDEQNNATAQHFNELMKQADSQRKQAIVEKIDEARRAGADASGSTDSRFLDSTAQSGTTTFVGRATVAPQDNNTTADNDVSATPTNAAVLSPEAQALLERERKRAEDIHRRSSKFQSHATQKAQAEAAKRQAQEEKARAQAVTAAQTAAKMELAQSGNDLSVASIAQLANHAGQIRQIGPGEVEISLH